MKNFISYALVLAVFVALTPISSAQQKNKEKVPKIGYVDLQKVIINSKAGKSAKKAFEVKFTKKRNIIEQKTKALEKMKQEFIKNSTMLNESKRKEKAEQIEKQEKDLNRTREDFREELQKEDLELTRKILKETEEILIKTAQSEGYDMIVERTESGIIYASPQMDITDKIIKAYDKKQ